MPALSQFRPYLDTALAHLPLSLLILAVVFTLLMLLLTPRPHSVGMIVETFFRSFLFWAVGVFFLHGAVKLGMFGPDAAAVLGPVGEPSLATAHLDFAFAVVGFLALSGSFGLRLAAVLGIVITLVAPYAGAMPTTDLVVAHAPEAAIVVLSVLLILAQMLGSLGRTSHRQAATA